MLRRSAVLPHVTEEVAMVANTRTQTEAGDGKVKGTVRETTTKGLTARLVSRKPPGGAGVGMGVAGAIPVSVAETAADAVWPGVREADADSERDWDSEAVGARVIVSLPDWVRGRDVVAVFELLAVSAGVMVSVHVLVVVGIG